MAVENIPNYLCDWHNVLLVSIKELKTKKNKGQGKKERDNQQITCWGLASWRVLVKIQKHPWHYEKTVIDHKPRVPSQRRHSCEVSS
jgi:hypothetical protein